MDIKQKEMWKRTFGNFTAMPLVINQDFFIVDWRNKNGSGEYAVRYILDIQRGELVITGDIGYAIASWYNPVSPRNMCQYVNDIGYFISKLRCSSDKYTYHWQDVKEDLECLKETLVQDGYDKISVDADIEDLLGYFSDMEINENTSYPEPIAEIFEKYDQEWYESQDFCKIGKRINPRVYGWAIGFQMACEQMYLI